MNGGDGDGGSYTVDREDVAHSGDERGTAGKDLGDGVRTHARVRGHAEKKTAAVECARARIKKRTDKGLDSGVRTRSAGDARKCTLSVT